MPVRAKLMTGVLLLAYPLAIHVAVVFNQIMIASVVLLLVSTSGIVISYIGDTVYRASRRGSVFIFCAMAIFSVLNLISHTQYALYFPPILVNLAMLAIFATTLLPGREPLITKFHRLTIGPDMDSAVAVYTRRLTWIWVFFFAGMALEATVLAVFAPLAVWSLFVNFLNYVFVIVLLVSEYFYRVMRYPHQSHPSLTQFLRSLVRSHWMQSSPFG
jgi:uncharacterized membrane protein